MRDCTADEIREQLDVVQPDWPIRFATETDLRQYALAIRSGQTLEAAYKQLANRAFNNVWPVINATAGAYFVANK